MASSKIEIRLFEKVANESHSEKELPTTMSKEEKVEFLELAYNTIILYLKDSVLKEISENIASSDN